MRRMIALALCLFSMNLLADSDCDYHFNLSNATIELTENSQVIEQTIRVYRGQNSPRGRCGHYRVYFSKGLANSYQRKAFSFAWQTLNYNLHNNINQAGVLKEFGDAVNSNEFIQGEAPDRFTNYTKSVYISIPGLTTAVMPAGTYLDLVQVTIYGLNESSGKYLFEETQSFTTMFRVLKRLQVSLIDEGGTFDPSSTSKVLDFGILSQNLQRGADLRVVSNGPYQIRLSSQNNGRLKQGNGETIAYAMQVNGSMISLASSATAPVQIGSGLATSDSGSLYNLKIRISEDTKDKSAGSYQDVITITAIAN